MRWVKLQAKVLLDCNIIILSFSQCSDHQFLINSYRVKQATNSETGEDVAIKILDKEKIKQEDLGESIKKEISFKTSIFNYQSEPFKSL